MKEDCTTKKGIKEGSSLGPLTPTEAIFLNNAKLTANVNGNNLEALVDSGVTVAVINKKHVSDAHIFLDKPVEVHSYNGRNHLYTQ